MCTAPLNHLVHSSSTMTMPTAAARSSASALSSRRRRIDIRWKSAVSEPRASQPTDGGGHGCSLRRRTRQPVRQNIKALYPSSFSDDSFFPPISRATDLETVKFDAQGRPLTQTEDPAFPGNRPILPSTSEPRPGRFQSTQGFEKSCNMTWRCSGATNQEMIGKLREANILTTDAAEAAMLAVDRGRYCHEADPYLDRPRRIGYNVTISAPHMHAYALSILTDQLRDGARALDVGSGSGYLTACMAFMVGPRGCVIGLEHIPELIKISERNVRDDCSHFMKEGRVKFIEGDGRLGYPEGGPYDAIHVGAAADSLPQELIDQLAPGGRMVCPVVAFEGYQKFQDLVQIDKNDEGVVSTKKLMHVSYVLLTDPSTQLRN